jgi:hypothetical protein
MHVLDQGVREPGAAGLEHEAKAGDGTRTERSEVVARSARSAEAAAGRRSR